MRLIAHHYFNEKREAGKRDSLSESRLPTSHSLLFNNVTPFQEMENYNVSLIPQHFDLTLFIST